MQDKLLYGKAGIDRIVGMEVEEDGNVTIFQQTPENDIVKLVKSYRYWILASEKLSKSFVKLEGDLHYCWGIQFTSIQDFYSALRKYSNQDIYKIGNQEEAAMAKDGYCFYQNLRISELKILSFDIESTGLDGTLPDAKVLLITTSVRDHSGKVTNRMFSYDEYETEGDLLDDFCAYVRETDPSVILGHNIISYDFVYLNNRAHANNTTLCLGRDGSDIRFQQYESKFRLDGTRELLYKKPSIYGREICDTFFMAISFDVSKNFESYSLKPLIKQLGFEKEGRQHYDASKIKDNYTNAEEWAKIKAYGQADSEDPIRLWDMMAPLFYNMCPMIPKPFTEILLTASGSKINALMVRAYLQDKHSIPKATEIAKLQGAISFAIPGIYSNCLKIDIASLYPNVIVQYEVYDKKKDPKAYLLKLVETFKQRRLELKRLAAETNDELYKQMDTTTKGILNSFYGFLSTQGVPFNSPESAAFITAKSREILSETIKWASGNDVSKYWSIASDKSEGESDGE